MWFNKLTGFPETSYEVVKENLTLQGDKLVSKVNGRSYQYGTLEIPTLLELKNQSPALESFESNISVSQIVANVQVLHRNPLNKNALFQAASQFNLLEMIGPHVSPESGVDIYESDFTQGPACAIACGAGTIYRNYFVPVNGRAGQTLNNQIDCLEAVGDALNNDKYQLWKMRNGYALPNQEGIEHINEHINQLSKEGRERLKEKLKIGIQWDTQVTLVESEQIVSQAYCSALPVAYSSIESADWESFARLILEATYEATLYAALINFKKTGSNKVYLTLVGGGAFGNDFSWIIESLSKSIDRFSNTPLDVKIVSYGTPSDSVQDMIDNLHS